MARVSASVFRWAPVKRALADRHNPRSFSSGDLGVAPDHCIVRAVANRYRLLDRHTAAGTFVNGQRISEHMLAQGDQISIGETVLLYREEAEGHAKTPVGHVRASGTAANLRTSIPV